jgi:putative ABC transport system substrate-binding protein
MRRRNLIAMIGGATMVLPMVARAAPVRPHIGVLTIGSREGSALLAALRDGLRVFGYIDGQTADIDYRYADGDVKRLPALARELLQSNPAVILADSPSAAIASKSVSSSVPIVCARFSDALFPRLAASYAHPGGNVTGLSISVEGMYGKLVELTLDAIPGVTRIGLLVNPDAPEKSISEHQVLSAAQVHSVEAVSAEAGTSDDLSKALQRLTMAKVQAVIVPTNSFLYTNRSSVLEWAFASRLPLISDTGLSVGPDALASYGVDQADNFRRAAGYIDKILKGAAPGDLPIEFPTRLELVINLKTAKALCVAIPQTLLARADEVIE